MTRAADGPLRTARLGIRGRLWAALSFLLRRAALAGVDFLEFDGGRQGAGPGPWRRTSRPFGAAAPRGQSSVCAGRKPGAAESLPARVSKSSGGGLVGWAAPDVPIGPGPGCEAQGGLCGPWPTARPCGLRRGERRSAPGPGRALGAPCCGLPRAEVESSAHRRSPGGAPSSAWLAHAGIEPGPAVWLSAGQVGPRGADRRPRSALAGLRGRGRAPAQGGAPGGRAKLGIASAGVTLVGPGPCAAFRRRRASPGARGVAGTSGEACGRACGGGRGEPRSGSPGWRARRGWGLEGKARESWGPTPGLLCSRPFKSGGRPVHRPP